MRLALLAALFVTILGCATTQTQFLASNDSAWNTWLNATIDVSLRNRPIGELSSRPPFEGPKLILNDIDPNSVVSLEAEKVTRRTALQLLAEKYNLSLAALTKDGQMALVLTTREARPLPKPLQ